MYNMPMNKIQLCFSSEVVIKLKPTVCIDKICEISYVCHYLDTFSAIIFLPG